MKLNKKKLTGQENHRINRLTITPCVVVVVGVVVLAGHPWCPSVRCTAPWWQPPLSGRRCWRGREVASWVQSCRRDHTATWFWLWCQGHLRKGLKHIRISENMTKMNSRHARNTNPVGEERVGLQCQCSRWWGHHCESWVHLQTSLTWRADHEAFQTRSLRNPWHRSPW